ncbi:hypothetical protein PVAND_011568 [Polypedilum vanderplanki]|uniref:Interference hedgehog n=1 Tax=Polypedilum vanderplanki TaxID=319348 RepID=A0A9J6CJ06_POLVA|nr:hypothetical protein PVAND_011568 [Polypedilum vanderplanki]
MQHIYFNQKSFMLLMLIYYLILSQCHAYKHDSETSLGTYMTVAPESTDAPAGDEVQLQCELNLPPEKVEFHFRPQNSTINDRDRIIDIQKMTSYNITTKDRLSKLHVYVNQKTVGDYRCVAWFGASAHASTSAKLRLASISLEDRDTRKPLISLKIAPRNSIILRCGNVTSSPDPVWSYYKDDILLPTSNQVQSKYGGYILKNLTDKDSGIYSCSAMNTVAGTEIKLPQRYSITVTPTSRSAPSFLLEPLSSFAVKPGENVLLECSAVSNPVFKATWSRPDKNLNLNDDRISIMGYGLQINNVKMEDEGTYICRLDNGENSVKIHTIKLNILQMPEIQEGPKTSLTNESESLELQCHATGSPTPDIYWMINGENVQFDPLIKQEGAKLIISSVEKRHAGIVQCFARNEVGEVNEGALLQVNPKQIDGEGKPIPLGRMPHKSKSRNNNNRMHNGKRKNKGPNLPNIAKPNITRLNDEAVMVKWSVMQQTSMEGSLPIQFFKVQYILIPQEVQQRKNEDWITLSEDIPPHLRSYEIHNLKPDNHYKFRISAVYSNNDNKQSPIRRFHLKRIKQNSKNNLPIPTEIHIESISETEVKVKWSIPEAIHHQHYSFGGFYISYRPTTSADDYLVVSCEGSHKRHHNIKFLEPGTNYEFKIQSFSAMAASEFSSIVTGRTLRTTVPPYTTPPTIKSVKTDIKSQNPTSFLPLIIIGGCALLVLILILVFIALKKRRDIVNNQHEEQESKSNPNHIQVDSVTNGRRSPILRNNRHLNGILRINITPNPLTDEKNDVNALGIPIIPPTTHQQLPPLGPHRKTLERNIRNNHHNQMPNGIIESTKTMIDGDLGVSARSASIRRQPFINGSNNSINNSSPRIIRSHQRVQRSPMLTRTASKRRGDIEQSTASLNSVNSIEV